MKHSHANDKNRGANAHTQILNTPTAAHSGRTHTDNNKVGGKERFLDELQPEGEQVRLDDLYCVNVIIKLKVTTEIKMVKGLAVTSTARCRRRCQARSVVARDGV